MERWIQVIIPRPVHYEPPAPKTHRIDPELIRLIFDTKWKCPICGTTMCGAAVRCVPCNFKGIQVPRP